MSSPEKPGRSPGDTQAPGNKGLAPERPMEAEERFAPDPSWAHQYERARRSGAAGKKILPIRTPMPASFEPPVKIGWEPEQPPEPEVPRARRWLRALGIGGKRP